MKFFSKFFFIVALALFFTGCSHEYFYRPEVGGDGATYAKRGVVYAIPPGRPEVKMKLTSMGITSPPSAMNPAYPGKMLRVRVLLIRTPQAPADTSAYLEPSEQQLVLSTGQTITPTFVHASVPKKSKIALNAQHSRHALDLYFPLPEGLKNDDEMQSFSMKWNIHYGQGQLEARTVRFDRFDSAPQTGGGDGVDEFSGFGETEGFAPGGDGSLDGWGWWGI
jgi:hypothetical protein